MQQVFNFYHLISYLKKELLAEAREHKVALKIRKDDNLPQILIGDPPDLFKRLYDLVNYSLKNSINDPLLIDLELFSSMKREVYIDFIINEPVRNLLEWYNNQILHNPSLPHNSTDANNGEEKDKIQNEKEANHPMGLKIEEVSEPDSKNFILRIKFEKADHLPQDQYFHLQDPTQTEALINKNKNAHSGKASKKAPGPTLSKNYPEELFSLKKLKEQSEGNEGFIQNMVRLFIDTTPSILEEMEKKLHQDDLEELAKLAHKLKPSIDTLEIESQTARIREIEQNAKTGENLNQLPELIGELKDGLNKVCIQLESIKQA